MKNYSKNRIDHLANYAVEKHLLVGGYYKQYGPYDHILKLSQDASKEDKYDIVKKYNILNNIKADMFKVSKLHPCAHHLNSSQVLCYNFFRPLICNYHPKVELIQLLKEHGISISTNAICEFEHGEKDGTEYDFYIEDTNISISFEIKYTESEFGTAKNNKSHRDKFDKIYAEEINNSPLLQFSKKLLDKDARQKDFFRYYQLYRNILRIKDKTQYVIFVCPKESERLQNEYNNFYRKMFGEYKGQIKILYWEDIKFLSKDPEFNKKYFE